MIVKIIPETDAEKANMKAVEHSNVREFFICGNKVDADGTGVDYHDWTGSYAFLIKNLYYFLEQIKDEARAKKEATGMPTPEPRMIKYGAPGMPTEDAPPMPPMPDMPNPDTDAVSLDLPAQIQDAVKELGLDETTPDLKLVKPEKGTSDGTEDDF